jgi:hypothetical protein
MSRKRMPRTLSGKRLKRDAREEIQRDVREEIQGYAREENSKELYLRIE